MTTLDNKAAKPEKNNTKERQSLQQPVWHVVVLGVFTLCVYVPFWFYKTWRDLRRFAIQQQEFDLENANEALARHAKARPLLLAIGILVPVLNVIFILNLFRDIALLIPDEKSVVRANATFASLLLTMQMAAFWFMSAAYEGVGYLMFTLTIVPLAIAQHFLNRFWASAEEGEDILVRHAFSPLELILLIFGSLWLGMVVVQFL